MFLLVFLGVFQADIPVFGMSGVGKSSFVNAMCNIVSSLWEVHHQQANYNDCVFRDTPGYGTKSYPVAIHFEKYRLKHQAVRNVAILCVAQHLYEADYAFVDRVKIVDGYELIVVRTQTDIHPIGNDTIRHIREELQVDFVYPFSTQSPLYAIDCLRQLILTVTQIIGRPVASINTLTASE